MHYVHYSAITKDSELPKSEFDRRPDLDWRPRFNDKKNRVTDELNEGVMVHARAVTHDRFRRTIIGFPWPNGIESNDTIKDENGNFYNCFKNENVENFWIPKFHKMLGKPIAP